MARTKGSKNKEPEIIASGSGSSEGLAAVQQFEQKGIDTIAVDFTNEQLNNLARKLNEVIERING